MIEALSQGEITKEEIAAMLEQARLEGQLTVEQIEQIWGQLNSAR